MQFGDDGQAGCINAAQDVVVAAPLQCLSSQALGVPRLLTRELHQYRKALDHAGKRTSFGRCRFADGQVLVHETLCILCEVLNFGVEADAPYKQVFEMGHVVVFLWKAPSAMTTLPTAMRSKAFGVKACSLCMSNP
ncbi:hypothetical protein D3C71_1483480 [compost metagenome]